MTFANKQISVFGLHRSGVAVAKLLDDLGAQVLVTDPKSSDELQTDIDALQDRDIDFILGGHDQRCIEKANLIVLSPGVPLDIPILQEARSAGIPITGELEVAASLCAAPMVAITGTKGKSTTTILTAELLKGGDFRRVCTAGNIGVPLSSEVQDLTAEDLVVIEASSFQLETTTKFRPVVSVVLNLSRDHLDRHKTMAAYRAAKMKVCANQTSTDWIVLNALDENVLSFADETQARVVCFADTATVKKGTYIEDNQIFAKWEGRSHWICDAGDNPLPGRHNLQNVLAATAVGQIFGISLNMMRSAICDFSPADHSPLEHAFEPVKTVNGVRFINDSKATNVAAVKAALESLTDPILLIMGGYDKGNNYQPLIECVQAKVKGLILLGSHTGIIRNALAAHVVTRDAGTMIDAVELAYSQAAPGDVVLLSPANASFDMFTDYKARGQAFREAVNHLESTETTSKSAIHLGQLSD
ncbi:UDP-N-acetylmuramoyl-L-alanine--D-glutamate ligase [Candidatus Poribacteria bacterium]|nr:MAG: UDP-N-acetylmuramoyl-L-alanine--D-glutamate ligase [Candidatus Poribacteria bacterium]